MLRLGRGHSLAESGLFSFESLSTDLVPRGPGLVRRGVLAAEPLAGRVRARSAVLMHRSLAVPGSRRRPASTRRQACSTRATSRGAQRELDRAPRFERPLSLLMVDLDLLREINNIVRPPRRRRRPAWHRRRLPRELRHYDVPARFGGEEFASSCRRPSCEEALDDGRAHPARRCGAARSRSRPRREPIRATISIGVAALPRRRREPKSSSTTPTSRSTARSSRGATASSPRRSEKILAEPSGRAERMAAVHSNVPELAEPAPAPPRSRPSSAGYSPAAVPARCSSRFRLRLALMVAVVGARGGLLARSRGFRVRAMPTDVVGLCWLIMLAGRRGPGVRHSRSSRPARSPSSGCRHAGRRGGSTGPGGA